MSALHRLWSLLPRPARREALFGATALLAPRPTRPEPDGRGPLLVAGYLNAPSGLGVGARRMLAAMRESGLDPIGATQFDELIKQLKESLGLTVFMVTHDLDSLHAICDRVAVLAEKKVLVTGTMADMLKVDHPWVKEYFHGPRARAALSTSE